MIVSLFPRITWIDSYVNDTVFISQHLLQPSIITSGLWLFEKNLRVYLFKENHYSPALLKVPIYSTELIVLNFARNVLC